MLFSFSAGTLFSQRALKVLAVQTQVQADEMVLGNFYSNVQVHGGSRALAKRTDGSRSGVDKEKVLHLPSEALHMSMY